MKLVIPGRRTQPSLRRLRRLACVGEPGTHNPRPVLMDSGLSALLRRPRPRMTAYMVRTLEASRGDYFFSSISVVSLRMAGVIFSATTASSQGNVTSTRT
jgi:hypothetical protein